MTAQPSQQQEPQLSASAENSEMTNEQQKPEKAILQVSQKSSGSRRVPMFRNFDSKMCIVTVLSYLLTWEQAEKFFRCLNSRGQVYFDTHKDQFRHFIDDRPIKRMSIDFGDKSFQVLRPQKFARIDFLEFGYIMDDLHVIEKFAEDTMRIERLHIGNRGFKLFTDAHLDEMVGLTLPFMLQCRESDRANLRTLVSLLKKTRVLSLDRIKTTWPILRVLCLQPQAFPTIKGIRLEFSEHNFDLFCSIPEAFLEKIEELGLNEVNYNKDPTRFTVMMKTLLMKTKNLKYLRISPVGQQASWIGLLAECAQKLSNLEHLVIGAQTLTDSSLLSVVPMPGVDANRSALTMQEMQVPSPDYTEEVKMAIDAQSGTEIPFSRMTPFNQKKHLAEEAHVEYAKYADVFKSAFLKLKSLQIDDGYFSFKTAGVFPPVKKLTIKGTMNPDPFDRLCREGQLANLKSLTVSNFTNGGSKVLELLSALAEAPRLEKLSIDLSKIPLECSSLLNLLGSNAPLNKLKLTAIDFTGSDVGLFACLNRHKTLKTLDLNVANLFTSGTHRNAEEKKVSLFDHAVRNQSVTHLKIRVRTVGARKFQLTPHWLDFLHMFENLEQLTFSGVGFPNTCTLFREDILGRLPLRSLTLQKCTFSPSNLEAMLSIMTQKQMVKQLQLDIGDLKQPEVEAIIRMLQGNSSLKMIHLHNVKIPIEITLKLLVALGNHPELKRIELRNSKLGYTLEAELKRIEKAISQMAQAPTTLRTLILGQIFSNTMAMATEDVALKKKIVHRLAEQLPHLQHIKL